MESAELASERAYVASLYARLDQLRDAAQSELESVRRANQGGTHQNRSERDAFARIYEDRVNQLTEIDERLDRKSTRLNSSHSDRSRMPSSA